VVKVGGSLDDGRTLADLGHGLLALGRRHRLLIVPGGGRFADAVRDAARRYPLDDTAAHWMAILGMDQYGYLLASQMPGARLVRDLATARRVAEGGKVPVLLPFDLLHAADPLPHTWEVTSDSLAAWVCGQAGARRLVLLKDVDGLYSADPHADPSAALLGEVELSSIDHPGGVDAYLATLLPGLAAEVWVLGGATAGPLGALLEGHPTRGTRLRAASGL
jgi:aspartokinase-like uncharacterized kinase